ncbi:MAG: 4a-hydroxytetrahydrobiopterin dehydratase [Halobacteria archaeon]|nr:4a-hydroxytetrahydrobiopterin dehydratase [Halobacteria archaeon]
MTEYSESEIEDRLDDMEGLVYDGDRIRRSYEFDTYMDGVDFVNQVAELAEDANHHPDIILAFRKVVVTLKSHDVDEITDRDFDLAGEVDELFESE